MKVVVYDEHGNPHSVEAVDAREMIESGSYMKEDPNSPPAKPAVAPAQTPAAKPPPLTPNPLPPVPQDIK